MEEAEWDDEGNGVGFGWWPCVPGPAEALDGFEFGEIHFDGFGENSLRLGGDG